jgi:hypothetical protein
MSFKEVTFFQTIETESHLVGIDSCPSNECYPKITKLLDLPILKNCAGCDTVSVRVKDSALLVQNCDNVPQKTFIGRITSKVKILDENLCPTNVYQIIVKYDDTQLAVPANGLQTCDIDGYDCFTASDEYLKAKLDCIVVPNWPVNLATDVEGTLPVVNGGTGRTVATPYAPIFGGTTATGPHQSGTVGTAGQVLVSNGVGALPTFQTVVLVTDGNKGDITISGTGTVYTINNGVVSNAKFRDSAGISVVARSADSVGSVADLTATTINTFVKCIETLGVKSLVFANVNLTSDVSGILPVANGGTNISTYTQGDLLYASAAGVISKLAKSATATRYLSNTGASNDPAWTQVNLANGVSGDLPLANLAQGSALSVLGVAGNATADNASIAASASGNVLRRSGTTLGFGAVDLTAGANAATAAWTTWSPTPTGFSAVPTLSTYKYLLIGKICWIKFYQGADGTSNATTFLIPLPFAAANISNMEWYGTLHYVKNNGAPQATPGMIRIASAATNMELFINDNFGAWANVLGKRAQGGDIIYEVA